MNFYDFTQIKAAADCAAVARDFLGLQVSPEGRCAATWRGGGNPESVSINKDGWHDFATEESGSVIDLVARVRCGGNIMEAQELLGVYLHLSPKMATKTGCIESNEKYDRLIASGYREVKRYSYTDASGALVNQVVRLEHPTQKKEFLQCTPRGWGLRDVIPPLYNLPMLRISSWALLVEGEKVAARVAQKRGKTVPELLQEWAEAGEEASDYGTRTHENCEYRMKGMPEPNIARDDRERVTFANAVAVVDYLKSKYQFIAAEKILFSPRCLVAGTVDLLMADGNVLWILDYKTNKAIKRTGYGMGLGPLADQAGGRAMSRNPGVSTRPPPSASAGAGRGESGRAPPRLGPFQKRTEAPNNDEIKEK